MSQKVRVLRMLTVAWMAMTAAAQAGILTTIPAQPSSRDTIRIGFYEDDWHDACPPELQEVIVDGNEVTMRLATEDGCILVFYDNPYTASAEVGPLPPGTYNLTVEAPDYSSREPELTSATVEVREAVQCGLVNQPAATLLLPYFEVDVEDPGDRNTLFSVGNAGGRPALAHAVVWTNWGVPVLSFDFFVPAEGIRSFSVRDLVRGRFPQTSPPPDGSFASCTDPLTLPQVDEGFLATLLTGQPHPEDGLCYSGAVEGGRLATGYVTVDVVRDCSGGRLRTPFEQGYFLESGAGLATNDNVLWGDFFLVDPANDFAQGERLVTLVADAARFGGPIACITAPCPQRISRTFYEIREGNRMPLGQTYRARFLRGGGFAGETELVVWIAEASSPQECGTSPSSFQMVSAAFRNEAGEETATHEIWASEQTFRVRVGGDRLPVEESFGSVDVSGLYFNGVIGVPLSYDLQVWVMPLVSALDRFSVGTNAVPIEDFCRW